MPLEPTDDAQINEFLALLAYEENQPSPNHTSTDVERGVLSKQQKKQLLEEVKGGTLYIRTNVVVKRDPNKQNGLWVIVFRLQDGTEGEIHSHTDLTTGVNVSIPLRSRESTSKLYSSAQWNELNWETSKDEEYLTTVLKYCKKDYKTREVSRGDEAYKEGTLLLSPPKKTLCLLVGCNLYDDDISLMQAVNDVCDLNKLDRTSVVLVHDNMEDNEPTLANVEKHLTSLCKKANSESNHALFIHFSTHCEMIDEIPHLSLRDGKLSLKIMLERLSVLPTVKKLISLDACNSSIEVHPYPGVTLFAHHGTAYESPASQNGHYTKALVESIRELATDPVVIKNLQQSIEKKLEDIQIFVGSTNAVGMKKSIIFHQFTQNPPSPPPKKQKTSSVAANGNGTSADFGPKRITDLRAQFEHIGDEITATGSPFRFGEELVRNPSVFRLLDDARMRALWKTSSPTGGYPDRFADKCIQKVVGLEVGVLKSALEEIGLSHVYDDAIDKWCAKNM